MPRLLGRVLSAWLLVAGLLVWRRALRRHQAGAGQGAGEERAAPLTHPAGGRVA